MKLFLLIFSFIGVLSGFFIFRPVVLPKKLPKVHEKLNKKISVIIPARNEEKNLPYLLESLQRQTKIPDEIIVVNDHSEDRTKEIAMQFPVKLIDLSPIPPGWLGKTWALWNGYLHSSGEILIFLDCDVRLSERAIETLIEAREQLQGAISVVPFHKAEKFYEKLAMITNILGLFSFFSPIERKNTIKGLYGSCIVILREDYEAIGGHKSVKSEIVEDMCLGMTLGEAGISVTNFLGKDFVSFRMYPDGIKSELEGFAKSAALSIGNISKGTIFFIVLWILGLFISEMVIFLFATEWFIPLAVGYILYIFQIFYMNKYTGNFGLTVPIFHFLSFIFFIIMLVYSTYQSSVRKAVIWKGRTIQVGRREVE